MALIYPYRTKVGKPRCKLFLHKWNVFFSKKKKTICRHYAASKNRIEIVKLLLEHKAQPNVANNIKQTPLHRAAVQGYTAVVRMLLEAKCRVNPKDSEGNTPMHLACEENHGDTAILLLQNGANEDQLNTDGKSPLDVCRTKELRQFLDKHIQDNA